MNIRTAMINALFLPESFWESLHDHHPMNADFICPQAFGRNTYPEDGKLLRMKNWLRYLLDKDRLTNINIVRAKRDKLSDDISMFEWLCSQNFDPGYPNRILAHRCIKLAQLGSLFLNKGKQTKKYRAMYPVIGQWEVLYAMWLIEPAWYAKHQDILIPIWPPLDSYLGTRGMLFTVQDIAEAHHLRNPLIIAHPEHIQRCFFIARQIFRGSIALDHYRNTNQKWFDKGSVQFWTRGRHVWFFYEMCVRIHHRFYDWI